MKIWALTKIGLKECLRQRVVYFIFLISLLFVFMAKGCDIGTIKSENLLIGQEARQGIAFGISFHGIVFWSIMLCGLLASQALTRDMDEGFASATLARPLGRDAYIAGKLLPVIIISTLNLHDAKSCALRPHDFLPVAVHPAAAGTAGRHCGVYDKLLVVPALFC
jgi:ABC-type transport system involved in multi-copper enzyme maturation permease subunit